MSRVSAKNYASHSFWLENSGDDLTPRDPLDGSIDVDVAILGAGFTGLWTAYQLLRRDPSLNVLIVEKEIGRLRRLRPQRRLVLRRLPLEPLHPQQALRTRRRARRLPGDDRLP